MTTANPLDLDNFPRPRRAADVLVHPLRGTDLGNFPTLQDAIRQRDADVAAVTDALLEPIVETLRGVVRSVVFSKVLAHEDLHDALAAYEKGQDVLEKVAAWMRESHLTGVPMYGTVLDALEA